MAKPMRETREQEQGIVEPGVGVVRVCRDGDAWCALAGTNLQAGIAGFGPTPADAVGAFAQALQGRQWPWLDAEDDAHAPRWNGCVWICRQGHAHDYADGVACNQAAAALTAEVPRG